MNWLFILLIVAALVYLLFWWWIWSRRFRWSVRDQAFFKEKWQNIMKMDDHRHQLLEADKLLDHMLTRRGYRGSLGDKLKRHPDQFKSLNALWSAHKLRNKLAHELEARITRHEVEDALEAFRKAFGDMGLSIN